MTARVMKSYRAAAGLAGIFLIAALAGCTRETQPIPRTPQPSPPPPPNLLSAVRGAVILDRSGEYALDTSPFQAIDTDLTTFWATPPEYKRATTVVELPARSRLRAAGLAFPGGIGRSAPRRVRFEASPDGQRFSPVGVLEVRDRPARQTITFPPQVATHLRVSIEGTFGDSATAAAPDLLAEGEEIEPWQRPRVEGEWRINNHTGRLAQAGNRVWGTIDMDPPMLLDGGWAGRVLRLAWLRGSQYGWAVIGVSREGTRLDGCFWYEKPETYFLSESWFGERIAAAGNLPQSSAVPEGLLRHYGHAPLLGLEFGPDGELESEGSASALDELTRILRANADRRFQLLAYELREPTPEANRVKSNRMAVSLQRALRPRGVISPLLSIEARGSTDPDAPNRNELQRAIYSRVELAISR